MTDASDTLAHLRRREAEDRADGRTRPASLRSRLQEAVALLRRHGARKILLFGSVARGDTQKTSDVDLAVEGLPPERYFEATAGLMRVFSGPVDLVRLEEASESLRSTIFAEGEAL